jgi:hypothetical protein
MKVENPIAFSFIMQEDIYLLNNDKTAYAGHIKAQPVIETPVIDFNYLGKHKKKFLVIVHYPEFEFMDDKHLTALASTLKRLEFSLDDVAILNRRHYTDTTFEQLFDFFTPQNLLILGQQALPPGIEALALNKPKQIDNCHTLFTFSFNEMMDSTESKKIFWEQMKQL